MHFPDKSWPLFFLSDDLLSFYHGKSRHSLNKTSLELFF